ncbi:hypothetical protein D9M72_611000 [compost metagenome]
MSCDLRCVERDERAGLTSFDFLRPHVHGAERPLQRGQEAEGGRLRSALAIQFVQPTFEREVLYLSGATRGMAFDRPPLPGWAVIDRCRYRSQDLSIWTALR